NVMCPVLNGVSGIFPLGGSAAALSAPGAATRPAPARPVPPTVTPSAPRKFATDLCRLIHGHSPFGVVVSLNLRPLAKALAQKRIECDCFGTVGKGRIDANTGR